MESIDGYQRAALALRDADPLERDWLLSQLDADDRQRIESLLQEQRETPDVATPGVAGGAAGAADPVALIEGARFEMLRAVLRQEPEWVPALLLNYCGGSPALHQYVSQSPEAERIRALVKPMREEIRPAVRDLVLRRVAARVGQSDAPEKPDFEAVLQRVAS